MLIEKKEIKKSELSKIFMEKFSLQDVQMDYYFEQKLNSGELNFKNGILSLGKKRKK